MSSLEPHTQTLCYIIIKEKYKRLERDFIILYRYRYTRRAANRGRRARTHTHTRTRIHSPAEVDAQRAADGHSQGRRFPANICRRNNSSGGGVRAGTKFNGHRAVSRRHDESFPLRTHCTQTCVCVCEGTRTMARRLRATGV